MPQLEIDPLDTPQSVTNTAKSTIDNRIDSDRTHCAALFDSHEATASKELMSWDALCSLTREPFSVKKHESPCLAPQVTGVKRLASIKSHGCMTLLWLDIDEGDQSLDEITTSLNEIGVTKAIVYSTASAMRLHDKTGEQCGHRWRVLIAISKPIDVGKWVMIQKALSRQFSGDLSAARPQQILYAPNIPPKQGSYYEHAIIAGRPLDIDSLPPAIEKEIDKIIEEQEIESRKLQEKTRKRLFARRARPLGEFSINEANHLLGDTTALVSRYGFIRTGNNRYISPLSSSGNAGFVVFNDGRWYSHHQSDREAGLGLVVDNCCCGDAFDLYCYYEHENDASKALKSLAHEAGQQTGRFDQRYNRSLQQLNSFENEVEQFQFDPIRIGPGFLLDISDLPQRPWLIRKHLIRGYVSVTFSPGGVGKSNIELTKAISAATGRDLLGLGPIKSCNVLVINNEDDDTELTRRIAAIMMLHGIKSDELNGRLFVISGYGTPFQVIWQTPDGALDLSQDLDELMAFIKANDIGLVSVDPFISTHTANENDNTAIDKVIGIYKRVAHQTQVSLSLVHHTRKLSGDSEAHAGEVDSGRGASSLKDAARCVSTLARMSEGTARKLGISPDDRVRFLRLDEGKLNFELIDSAAKWFKMETITISNGDQVGAVRPFNMAPYFERAKSEDRRNKWTSETIAKALHRVVKKDKTKFLKIREQFEKENGIGQRQARELVKKISSDPDNPTCITIEGNRVGYWYTKENSTAPVMIHRRYL